MNDRDSVETKKGFFQNDRLLVCSMLAFYGICILGLVGGTFAWLGKRNETISANATSTAFAVATQQANSTSTAIVRSTEQAGYEFVDPFDKDVARWLTGPEDDEYMTGSITIKGGIYEWDIREVKQSFVYWSNFYLGNAIKDFDVYVDTKIIDAEPADACSGFVFRSASFDWEDGAYTFSVCNNSTLNVSYYKKGEWDTITYGRYSSAIRNNEWNRLEISARGDHFTFIINNETAFEMTDDRLQKGGLAMFVDINELDPVIIWFDNFGFQRHY